MRRRLKHDLARGLWLGASAAVFCSILALAVTRLGGGEAVLRSQHVRLPELIPIYAIGGLGGGLIWGVLRPLNRWVWGAMVNGYCASLPGIALIVRAQARTGEPLSTTIELTLLTNLIGALVGAYAWFYFRGDRVLPWDD